MARLRQMPSLCAPAAIAAAVAVLASTPAVAFGAQHRGETVNKPPRVVTARRMQPRSHDPAPGTLVPAREVTARSFANARDGFGLAIDGDFPARTVNGGKSWFIDGPVFHIPAADGAEAVEYTGAVGASTEFAYGSSAVDITTNSGSTWWQAFLGELVLAVTFQNNRLIALVQQQTSQQAVTATTWVYISMDGGKRWRYDDRLGAL